MELRPIDRARRRRPTDGPVGGATAVGRALWIAGLCIAAFESSQLVFHSATLPSWAEPSERMARAAVEPSGFGAGASGSVEAVRA